MDKFNLADSAHLWVQTVKHCHIPAIGQINIDFRNLQLDLEFWILDLFFNLDLDSVHLCGQPGQHCHIPKIGQINIDFRNLQLVLEFEF